MRVFTPARELPIAGHPTLGSCHAWLEAGGRPRAEGTVVQECGAGLIPIRRSADELAFAAPPLVRSGPADAAVIAQIGRALGLASGEGVRHHWVDNGPGWVAVMLASAERVLAVEPDDAAMKGLELGVVGPYPEDGDPRFEVRAFVTEGDAEGQVWVGGVSRTLVSGRIHCSGPRCAARAR